MSIKARVVGSLALLLGAKLVTIQVTRTHQRTSLCYVGGWTVGSGTTLQRMPHARHQQLVSCDICTGKGVDGGVLLLLATLRVVV